MRRQYQKLHNDLQVRMTNTPSPSLKRMYQKNLQELKHGLRGARPRDLELSVATVFAPASIGNVGPGFDVLGLAVEGPGDEVRLERVDGPSSIEEVSGLDAELIPREPDKNVVTVAAEAMLRALGEAGGVRVWLRKGIAQSGGLGEARPRRWRARWRRRWPPATSRGRSRSWPPR